MKSRGEFSRRTFLKSVAITPIGTKLMAAEADPPSYIRLRAAASDGEVQFVEFQFASDAEFKTPQSMKLVPPTVGAADVHKPTIWVPSKLQTDEGKYYHPNAGETIVINLNGARAPGDLESWINKAGTPGKHNPRLSLVIKKDPKSEHWRVRLETRVWILRGKNSKDGRSPRTISFGAINGPDPLLQSFLASRKEVVNILSSRFVEPTLSHILGVPISHGQNSRVGFSLRQNNDGDVVFAGRWTVRPSTSEGTKTYRAFDDELNFKQFDFAFPDTGDVSQPEVLKEAKLSRILERRLGKGVSIQVEQADYSHLQADDRPSTQINVVRDHSDPNSDIYFQLPAMANARMSLRSLKYPLAELCLCDQKASSSPQAQENQVKVALIAQKASKSWRRKVDLTIDSVISDASKNGPLSFQSLSFGLVQIKQNGARLHLRSGSPKRDAFRIEGKLSYIGLTLDEEEQVNSGVSSKLTWSDDPNQPDVILGIRDVSEGRRPAEVPAEEEEHSAFPKVVIPRSAILLDWRRKDPLPKDKPFHRAPLDLAMEGAELDVRRHSDRLAVAFRFHNMRLVSQRRGSSIVMHPLDPLLIDNIPNDRPERPILTMEIPGGHVFKQSHTAQLVTASDLPQPDYRKLFKDSGNQADRDGTQPGSNYTLSTAPVEALYNALRTAPLARRKEIRKELQRRILDSLEIKKKTEFQLFAKAFAAEATRHNGLIPQIKEIKQSGRNSRIPDDQMVYIGPDYMDRDLWKVARRVALSAKIDGDKSIAVVRLEALLRRAETQAVRDRRYKLLLESANQQSHEVFTDREMKLSAELRVPGNRDFANFNAQYQKFRKSSDAKYLFLPEIFPGMHWLDQLQNAQTHPQIVQALLELMRGYGQRASKYPRVSKSRLGGRSRFCFFWDSRRTPTEKTPFSLAALLDRDGADLSVPLRARKLFEVDESGNRRQIFDIAATLAQQGIRPRQAHDTGALAIGRMSEVYNSARRGIAEWETSLELLARIQFSIPQDSILESHVPVNEDAFSTANKEGDPRNAQRHPPSWSVSVAADTPNPGLRAIASPDFNPLVFLAYAKQDVKSIEVGELNQEHLNNIYKVPTRGPEPPWERLRPQFAGDDVVWPVGPERTDDEEYQNALSAYHRHSLVATSVPGRPGPGEVVPIENPTAAPDGSTDEADEVDSRELPVGSVPAPPEYRLDDIDVVDPAILKKLKVRVRQSILTQQNLEFSQVTLSPLGPSVSIDAPLQPKAPALDTGKRPLFEPVTIEQFTYESTYGEDEGTRILEKGYLFPLGIKATRVTQTTTAVIHPSEIEKRDFPATKEITRTWISVSEPVKTKWFGQAHSGRERPFDRCEVVTLRTPDLVSPDRDPNGNAPHGELATGRVNLGSDSKGLVFWPRIAPHISGTFRFEVIFDDGPAAVEVPLIFVDFAAATDPLTMERLVAYYMEIGLDSADKGDVLRSIDHRGQRRRYAPELRDGDTTYETFRWILGAEGRKSSTISQSGDNPEFFPNGMNKIAERGNRLGGERTDYSFDALLSASDQPPFYPFMQAGEIRADRIGRQLGQRHGPELEVAYDSAFVLSTSSDEDQANGPLLPDEGDADIVLGVVRPKKLDVGDRGASVGAIGRPSGFITGLARREGPLLYKDEINATDISFAALPTELAVNFSTSSIGGDQANYSDDTNLPSTMLASQPNRVIFDSAFDPAIGSSGDLAKVICEMLGDPDMKILGVIKVCDLIQLLTTTLSGPLADNMPVFEEISEYGEDVVGQAEDQIQKIKNQLVGPLSELIGDLQKRLQQPVTIPGAKAISPLSILPDVQSSMAAFKNSLDVLKAAEDRARVLRGSSEVVASGKSLVRALDDVAKDPVTPLRTGLVHILSDQVGFDIQSYLDTVNSIELDVASIEQALLQKARTNLEANVDGLDTAAVRSTFLSRTLNDDGLNELESLLEKALKAAVKTAFDDGNGVALTRFQAVLSGLNTNAPEGAKWRQFFDEQGDSLAAFIEEYDEHLEQPGRDIVRNIASQHRALRIELERIKADSKETEEQFQTMLNEADEAAKRAIEQTRDQVRGQLEKVRKQAESKLTKVRDDLVRRIFNLDIVVARQVLAAATYASEQLRKFDTGEVRIEGALRAVINLLKAIDRAYFAGTYHSEIASQLNKLVDIVVVPIHDMMCLVADYSEVITAKLTVKRQWSVNSQKVKLAFEGARKDSNLTALKVLASSELVFEYDKQAGIGRPVAWKPVDEPTLIIEQLTNVKKHLVDAIAAADEAKHKAFISLLQLILVRVDTARNDLLGALESYCQSLVGVITTIDQNPYKCPELEELRLAAGNPKKFASKLEELRLYSESFLAGWLTLISETESLTKNLVNQFDVLAGDTFSLIKSDLDAVLKQAQQDSDAILQKAIKDTTDELKKVEKQICHRVLRAVTPTALFLIRSVDTAVTEVVDPVVNARNGLVGDLLESLAALSVKLDQARLRAPIIQPMVEVGQNTISQLTSKLKGCANGEAKQKLATLMEQLAAFSSFDVPQNSLEPKSEQFKSLVKSVKTLPEQLAKSLVCDFNGDGLNLNDTQAELKIAAASTADSVLSLAKALRVEAEKAGQKFVETLREDLELELMTAAAGPIKFLAGKVGTEIYDPAIDLRRTALERLSEDGSNVQFAQLAGQFLLGINDLRELFIAIDRKGKSKKEISNAKTVLIAKFESGQKFNNDDDPYEVQKEKLEAERDLLQDLENADNTKQAAALFRKLEKTYGNKLHTPALEQIFQAVGGVVNDLARADLTIKLDLSDMKELLEQTLLSFVPTRISNSMKYELPLSEVGGIFQPKGNRTFRIEAKSSIDLLNIGSPQISTKATMSPFDVALFGDAFDAFTMQFSGARFVVEPNREPDFDIRFVDYKIGEQAKFIQDLAAQMGQDSGGFYLEITDGFPGITAGYRLNLPAMGLGAVTFLNVGIVAGAILPFDNREALFSVGISSRRDPFIILVGAWGGGGHFTLYSNGQEMLGFDTSFVFAGGGAIAAGPLSLMGRVSVGVFIRKVADFSEISGDFFAGGSGRIAIFGVSSALTVRVGQDGGGNMVGSAVFSFSFSVGFAKVRFAITLYKKEGQGFKDAGSESGGSAALEGSQETRVAGLGSRGPLSDQLWLAALNKESADETDEEAEVFGEGEIEIAVTRFEHDFKGWRENFAPVDDLLQSCLETLGHVE